MKLPSRLAAGYRAFVDSRLPLERSRYQKLAEAGQQPEVMVISCCDSRVAPEVIFDAHPGELFVVRNVANLVPPYAPTGLTHGVSAALEFAVQELRVKYVVVMGHSHCGGIRTYVEHKERLDPGDFIDNWITLIAPAAKFIGDEERPASADYLRRLERESIVTTLGNLLSFPWIRSRVEGGNLQLLGAYFDVGTGGLEVYDSVSARFIPVGRETLPHAAAAAAQ
jgi:carbonic anhydrase